MFKFNAEWSAYLISEQDVAGSIPGTYVILKVDEVWNGLHPGL